MLSLTDIQQFYNGTISFSEPVARYCPLRVGGPADYVLHATSADEVDALQKFFTKNAFPHIVLLAGTIVSDRGFRGAVILVDKPDDAQAMKRTVRIFKSNESGAAEALIDMAGLNGVMLGGAEIVGNSVANTGNATAADIRALAVHACRIIEEQCGVRQEMDMQFVGFESDTLARVA
ncbi:MAG: hypothetical protein KF749_06220 [Bacteroidetes bacterium]|nr:hypothetical protein [Bacteroidota bacterium]MCW5894618.1 hypothetical protein [Bacteroidota bacterium]